MRYKCIIFDCDGVLVDSEIIANKAIVKMAAELGVQIDLEFAMKHFSGVSIEYTKSIIEDRLGHSLSEGFEPEFRKRTYAAFKSDLKPIEGVLDLLSKIEVPICVASSGPVEKLKLSLTTTGLIHFFENCIFSSYDINNWKPNPEIFLYAAREMGFLPNECVVIEDSLAGIEAARKGGFDVFGIVHNNNSNDLEKQGASVFFNMKELYSLLS